MIRLIMTLTRGPTDPATTIEYTAWDVVDDAALKIGELLRSLRTVAKADGDATSRLRARQA